MKAGWQFDARIEGLFWSHVRRCDGDGCWAWDMQPNAYGYSRLKVARRTYTAHRLALAINLGRPLAPGEQANHGCDNRSCVRVGPGHIYLGDQKRNIADAMSRGRMNIQRPGFPRARKSGVQHHNAKINPDKVREIRSLREVGWSQQRIADLIGIAQTGVSCILRGKTWTHVI